MNYKTLTLAASLAFALVACPNPTPPTPDFTISSVDPASLTFTQPASGTSTPQNLTVTIARTGGFADAVTLSLVAPTGVTGVTGTGTIAAGASSGTLAVTISNTTATGTNNFTVQAVSGSITKTSSASITVNPPAPTVTEVKIVSTAALDGVVFSDTAVFNDRTTIRVGNTDATGRGFVSFDLSSLPGTLTATKVVSASLVMYQESFDSTGQNPLPPTPCNPFNNLTNATDKLVVESVSFGATLNSAVFNTAALSKIGNLSSTATFESKTLDVTAALKDDVTNKAARGNRSQYRLRFPVEYSAANLATQFCTVRLTSAEGATAANRPTLVIKYNP